jgi:hypothetical protein
VSPPSLLAGVDASSPEVQRPRLHFPEHGRQTSNSRHAEAQVSALPPPAPWLTALPQRQRLLDQTKLGLSGYDPEEEDMRGIFMARGPGKPHTIPSLITHTYFWWELNMLIKMSLFEQTSSAEAVYSNNVCLPLLSRQSLEPVCYRDF